MSQVELAEILKVLSNPIRLEIIRQLQTPQCLSELKISPSRLEGGEKQRRPMSRASIREHVRLLLELGAIVKMDGRRDGRRVDLYTVSAETMFVVAQDLLGVGKVKAQQSTVDQTRPLQWEAVETSGTGFALVNGAHEGSFYPLDATKETVTLGRGEHCDVSLPFDPYVSEQQSEIVFHDGIAFIQSNPSACNPTLLDWEELAPGASKELVPGAVVCVGRSTLVFRK